MKITVDPLDKIIRLTGAEDSSGLRMALAYELVKIWDQGYNEGFSDAVNTPQPDSENKCPYTHSHTKEWCGYDNCRKS